MNKTFDGKVVLVTGANSGIGETAAVLYARAGAQVFGVARRREAIEMQREIHPEIRWVLADVTDGKAVEAAARVSCAKPADSTCWSTTPRSSRLVRSRLPTKQ